MFEMEGECEIISASFQKEEKQKWWS
jgi:hypothetical protein